MMKDEIISRIEEFLNRTGWVPGFRSVSFLAAGEYNANYLVEGRSKRFVLRINHGSQLGLGQDQISYEYRVLKALESSGVTPKPLACLPDPKPLGGGSLLMEFLPGKALVYEEDLDRAAGIFARIHSQPVPDDLIVQADPVTDIARESLGLIQRFPDHPLREVRDRILAYHDEIMSLAEESRALFRDESLCLVNTEVNSGNFLISEKGAFLVDWEKAVVSYRYQDLGHFLVPTTTLWKTDTCLGPEEKRRFIEAYHREAGLKMDTEELIQKTRIMEKTILLRALSWCFMAFYEYTRTDRALQNQKTFTKIRQYLSDIPWILHSVA
ncbi:aminoglycoside phosphotransferase family protein [Desulfospira joergensenii]|uniref:aminoglycoside phosphotransferase family protein n=1 Tax=Desulfospira joergensenii TaxID=53329 RepID=UPI0003B5BFBB|nr:aminoglycoside phosphotransferase family protein [Desulfospira joergensenii]